MNPVVIDYDKCKNDGICAAVCPRKLFELDEQNSPTIHENAADTCIHCGHCMAACPPGAITLDGLTAEQCSPMNRNLWPMYQNIEHLMRSRRSVRAYNNTPVEKEIITELLDTARYAPTGSNSQATQWIAINDPARVKELGQMVVDWLEHCVETNHPLTEKLPMEGMIQAWKNNVDLIFRGAPALVINHAPNVGGMQVVNGAIAMSYLELAAACKDIGTCWAGFLMIAANHSDTINKALDIPEDHAFCSALMLGHSKFQYQRIPDRKELSLTWW